MNGRLFVESVPWNVQTGVGLLLVGEDIFARSRRGGDVGGGVDRRRSPPSHRRILKNKTTNVRYKGAKTVNRKTGGLEESIQQRGSVRKDVAQPCPRLLPLPRSLD